MREPEYLMCLECNTHCYNFDWIDDKLVGAVCAVCGNEDLDRFEIPEGETLRSAD